MAARTQFLLGRMDLSGLVNDDYKAMMRRIRNCTDCNHCVDNCPYKLDVPALLNKHLAYYEDFIMEYEDGRR